MQLRNERILNVINNTILFKSITVKKKETSKFLIFFFLLKIPSIKITNDLLKMHLRYKPSIYLFTFANKIALA